MGLKDHQEDGTGRILSLGLDLDYLHVEGTDRQASLSAAASTRHLGPFEVEEAEAGADVHNSSRSSSSSSTTTSRCTSACNGSSSNSSICSSCSEENIISDSEDERNVNGSVSESRDLIHQHLHHHHQDSSSSSQPEGQGLVHKQPLGNSPPQTITTSTDTLTDYRTKVEFALKLGYSEELVLLVLRKLGPDALINDILGELVKLGTKTDMEQQGGRGSVGSQSLSPLSATSACSSSTSSLDSCRLLCSSQLLDEKENLRPVVVDGSNVAMSHGNKEVFSCQGIQLAVDWFLDRGHRDITVFVPAWRKEQSRPDALITDQEILRRLEKEKILVFTPSRRVQGRRVVCYDDRFIVKLAYESDGIIVSNDNYRDLANEKPEWKKFIDERLLMYSFVNDKFMPPDDPLGRHGPSLDNFLRKRPIIPEHRKQPCPYGKKCTYGHKCKFYHPERGSQPQRSVADELRASAKSSSSASKSLGDSLIEKSHSMPTSTEGCQAPPKRLLDPSPRSYPFCDFLDDRLVGQTKVEACRASDSSGSSSCNGSFLPPTAPGGPPSLSQDWRDLPGRVTTNACGASGSSQAEAYPLSESPELDYNSLVRTYSSLSLVVPQSPERFFPADLRAGSVPSDCSSEGSVSSDSFSPDPLLDDGLKYHHHYHHHPSYHHHHCSSRYLPPTSNTRPSLNQHPQHGYSLPQTGRLHGFGLEEPPASYPHHTSQHSKPHLACLPPHLRHPSLGTHSNCPGDYSAPPPTLPQTSSTHIHSQNPPLVRNLMVSPWQDGGLQNSRHYEGSPLHQRQAFTGPNQQHQHLTKWDPHYQQPSQLYCEPMSFQSLSEGREKVWPLSCGRGTHLSPRAPPPSHPSLQPSAMPPAHPTHSNTSSTASQHPEPPALSRYQEMRDKVFVNLCNIFPPELVRVVMARNPHMIDAQQLAAAILMEKSQHVY